MSALEQWLMGLLLEHNVSMLRVEAEMKSKVLALLLLMQRDIVAIIASSPELSAMGRAAKNEIMRQSNAVIAEYYGRAALQVDLLGLAEVESMGVRNALAAVIDRVAGPAGVEVRIGVGMPTENSLRKLASDLLVQGSPAKAWWARQSADTTFKLANQIRIGAAQGETNQQIIKRIVGEDVTVAKAPAAAPDVAKPGAPAAPSAKAPPEVVITPGEKGIMPLARANAAAVVQTSMATVAAAARRATFEANKDITNGIMQVSTLDGHTSLTCIAYSGATWDHDFEPSGENDLPYNGGVPRHFNCRSSEIAIMKTLREMGIDMDEPDPGMRASSNGPISAKTTFADFLKAMGPAYQDETLGKGRADLFRAGKLTPRDLVDMKGRPLKLSALKELYAQ